MATTCMKLRSANLKRQPMGKQIIALFLILCVKVTIAEAQNHVTDSLLAELQQTSVDTQRVNLLCNLAHAYAATDAAVGMEHIEQALQLANEISYPKGRLKAISIQGHLHWVQGEYQKTIDLCQSVLDEASVLEYPELAFNITNLMTIAYARLGDLTRALEYYERELTIAQQQDDPKLLSIAYSNVGGIYSMQGDHPQALENFTRSAKMAEQANDKSGLCITNINIGATLSEQGSYQEALTYFQKALVLAEQLENRRLMSSIHNSIGEAYFEQADYKVAEENHREALTLALALGSPYETASSYSLLGQISRQRGSYLEALEYYQKALNINREMNSQPDIAASYKEIALLYEKLEQYRQAVDYANRGLTLAQKVGIKLTVRETAEVLYQSYRALNDYRKALEYYELATVYRDSLINEENAQEIQKLTFDHELTQREKENELLRVQAQSQVRQVALQKRIRNFFILACVLLCALAFLFIRMRHKEKKTNLLLNYRNEEISSTALNLTRANAEIILQRDALEEANRSKNKLFSVISHDLRSPLNSLQGLFMLLQDGHLSADEVRSLLPELSQRLHQTYSLLDNLLIWAKSQMEGIRAHPAMLTLFPLTQEIRQLVVGQAEHKNIDIAVDIPPSLQAYADLDMVMIVLRNLLTNAIKFTNEQGTVRITGSRQEDFVHLKVEDTGVGISEAGQKHLFVDNNTSTAGTLGEKGTGLGLLLSKDFVEKNGGTIWVESQVNFGTVFTFTLPATAEVFAQNNHPKVAMLTSTRGATAE